MFHRHSLQTRGDVLVHLNEVSLSKSVSGLIVRGTWVTVLTASAAHPPRLRKVENNETE